MTGDDTSELGARVAAAARAPLTVLTDHDWRRPGANPYLSSLYRRVEASGADVRVVGDPGAGRRRADVVHLHWPESALRHRRAVRAAVALLRRLGLVAQLRLRGTHVVWTAHNIGHHEHRHPRLERSLLRVLPHLLDHVIYLGAASRDEVERRVPAIGLVPSSVMPHGHYREAYDVEADRARARRSAAIPDDAPALLFFGQIRPYKGVDALLGAFAEWDRPDAVLTIAGAVKDPAYGRAVGALAARDGRVRLRPGRVDDCDVGELFAATDLVVLPFSDVLNSGSALLALSCSRRVLLPATPVFAELQAHVGADWVTLFDAPLTAADLRRAIADLPDDRPDLSCFDWDAIAAETVEIYRRLAGAAGTRRDGPAARRVTRR